MIVQNEFPSNTGPRRIALIGEAPGRDEELTGRPFVGVSGRLLRDYVGKFYPPNQCFYGNICQHRPPNNEIELFPWQGNEIQSGLSQLKADLAVFKPHICILLGKTALYAALDRSDISNMRGSLFICNNTQSPFFGYKCMATYHPAAVLRMYEWAPILKFDIQRGVSEGETSHLQLPKRDLVIPDSISYIESRLGAIKKQNTKCGTDIEGYVWDMSCIGIAEDPNYGFVIPFTGPDGGRYWKDEEWKVWKLLADYLQTQCPKVWQNGLYDRFVIQHSYGIVCQGNTDDTMLQWHEKFCELPKGLKMQASLLTKEPYYKDDRKADDWKTKMEYCIKDACITLEIHNQLDKSLTGESRKHYYFNRDLLNPLLYMELRGINYAIEKAKTRKEAILQEMYAEQTILDAETGFGHICKTNQEACTAIKETMCYKRGTPNSLEHLPLYAKKDYKDSIKRAVVLGASIASLTPAENGELSTLLKLHCNVESIRFRDYIYKTLKLPVQINQKTKQPTVDYHALLKLQKKTDSKVIFLAIGLRDKATHTSMLSISADKDGRIRCGYNAVGTNTGRLTCYTSPTGSGYNLQTIPKKDRDLFIADPGYHFFQCDLSGADGWTVGAHCKNLGDSTMLDDFAAKLKPARILTLMLRKGANASSWSRERLFEESKYVGADDTDYFLCKCLIWGLCYLLGVNTAIDLVFKESEGKILMTRAEMTDFKRLVFLRYWGVLEWHKFTSRRLQNGKWPTITAASGLTRRFFGRRDEILGEALSFEPQCVTTWATNKAALNLWNDPENRVGNKISIEPLHQVHDALIGQFPKDKSEWAAKKIRSYFNNTITIANQQVIIPFEGNYGESWGKLEAGKI